jgi:acyl dehydratase
MTETDTDASRTEPLRLTLDELPTHVGKTLGQSSWHRITQEQVNLFADATLDHQWIHVDPVRAKDGPFGQTIAHGYLTLSMAPVLLLEIVAINGVELIINYGANRVRFPATVLVGTRVRATAELTELTEVPGGLQAVFRMTFEADGREKPVCVAEIVFRFYRSPSGG